MSEWKSTTLHEMIATIESGSRPKGGVRIGENKKGVPSYGGENISINGRMLFDKVRMVPKEFAMKMTKGLLDDKDVLINKDGANTGKTTIYNRPAGEEISTINEHLFRLRCKTGIADQEFLFHFLNSVLVKEQILSLITGSAQPGLNSKFIEFVNIKLPPLQEQKKITEILCEIDINIENNKSLLKKYRQIDCAVLKELIEKQSISNQPIRLENLAEVRSGIAKNSKIKGDLVNMPYMRVANVQDGYLDLSEIKNISIEREKVQRYLLMKGDVLINEGGDLDKVGRGVIWNGEIVNCLHQNHVFAVRCSEELKPEFLALLLRSAYGKKYFLGCAKQTTNLASINSSQLKSFPIPIPSISIQNKVINKFEKINNLINLVSYKIESLNNLKQSISNDLLSGRKRTNL